MMPSLDSLILATFNSLIENLVSNLAKQILDLNNLLDPQYLNSIWNIVDAYQIPVEWINGFWSNNYVTIQIHWICNNFSARHLKSKFLTQIQYHVDERRASLSALSLSNYTLDKLNWCLVYEFRYRKKHKPQFACSISWMRLKFYCSFEKYEKNWPSYFSVILKPFQL